MLRTTDDFAYTRTRADRAGIRDEWIILAIEQPVAVAVQGDGRIHNAFFDRRFEP